MYNEKPSFTLIIFGLSGSGKTTLGIKVFDYLHQRGISSELLDADEYRKHLSPNASYSEEDRNAFRKKLFFVSSLLNKHNVSTIIPMISSDSLIRKYARENIKNIFEVYLSTNIETCIERNPKGLYTKTDRKFRENIVGIDLPFPEPTNPDLILDTGKYNILESLEIITEALSENYGI